MINQWFYSYNLYKPIFKFELGILSICNRINATENIRGINYRFSKNGSDLSEFANQIKGSDNANMKTVYVSCCAYFVNIITWKIILIYTHTTVYCSWIWWSL